MADGLARVVVDADAAVTPGGDAAGSLEHEFWVWAIPLPQLMLVGGVALFLIASAWRRRRRAGIENLIEDAWREAEAAVRDELKAAVR